MIGGVRSGRLLLHTNGPAAWNMAVDQAISESTTEDAAERPAATLRFYTWAEPTLSLGYFQSASDCSPRFDALARVRRSTGGGAILHHHELTYSLTVPSRPGEHGARSDLYRGVHQAIAKELCDAGVNATPYHLDKRPNPIPDAFLCFQRRTDEDLIVAGYKVCGSAQRRSKSAILQHGSILLRASGHASELPGIFDLTGIAIDPESFAARLADAIGQWMNLSFQSGQISPQERARTDQVIAQRFGCENWWTRR